MSTNKRLLIDATHAEETRVIIADEHKIFDFDISATSKAQNKGNIYLAKITRVEPSLQAAFVEYGGDRQGFLPFSEIHPDYYQIPVADRKKLIEEVAAEQEAEDEAEEQESTRRERGGRSDRNDRGRGRGRRRGGRNRRDRDAETNGEADAEVDVELGAETSQDDTTSANNAPQDDNAGDTSSSPSYQQEPIASGPAEKSAVIDTSDNDSDNGNDDQDDDQVEITGGDSGKSAVESLGDEDEFTRRRKASFLRRYKIQEVIKRNQVILVQVIKEERGNKGASLSSYISLAGRYCVLMPNSPKTGGISRKISSNEDRKRLKEISEEIRSSNGMSAIIRTAGIDRTRAEIKRDYDYLLKLWNQIREQTLSSTAPAMVYEEADIVKRSLRDLYSSDIKEVVVAGEDAHKRAKDFMKLMMPSHAARIKLHTDNTPILYAYDAEDALLRMHEPQVRLESGGSIVINPTEALVSIDVNSGRSTTERNVEETAVKTNLEAAQEIARQLRLRDLAGLIVIDFIDMFDYKNRRAVERQLKEALKSDRAKIQLGRISAFGLLEMSRQRLRPSFAETNTHSCPYCDGRGSVLTPDAQGIQLLRFVEKEASAGEYAQLILKAQPAVALYLLNTKREHLVELEKTHGLKISIEVGENLLSAASFILERYTAEGQKTEVNGMDGIPGSGKRARPRKRKRGERNDRPQANDNSNDSDSADDTATAAEEKPSRPAATHEDSGEERPRRRRRGGRRRGGRNRDERQPRSDTPNSDAPHSGEQDNAATAKAAPAEAPATAEQAAPSASEKPSGRTHAPKADKAEAKAPVADSDSTADAKPARKRAPRKTAAQKAAEAKANDGDKPVAVKSPEPKPAAAAKTAPAPQEKRELESVGADSGDKKEGNRKGWWRRIVD
jgi:ribonuclease E